MIKKDLGYGTEYEIFILKKIAQRLCREWEIKAACEYPTNNLLGQASIFPKGRKKPFDLVWNFCEFENQKSPAAMIKKMFNLSNKYLLIITQNNRNLGVALHYGYHLLTKKNWDHGDFKRMSSNSVLKEIKKLRDLRVIEKGAFDIPWFILDVYETGKYFRCLPFFKKKLTKMEESSFENWPFFLKTWLAHHHYLLIKKESK